MKKIICLICVIPMLAFGQMPVTDAAANTSLALMRNQLLQMNMQIKKTGIQLTTMNQNLERLINLLEENNTLTSKSKEILKEELEAKKGTPNFVLNSTEVSNTINLKDKILKVYDLDEVSTVKDNTLRDEALSALEVLGFNKKQSEKVIDKILQKEPNAQLEHIIKEALKNL